MVHYVDVWCPYQRGWKNICAVLSNPQLTTVSRASVNTTHINACTHTHRRTHTNEMHFSSYIDIEWQQCVLRSLLCRLSDWVYVHGYPCVQNIYNCVCVHTLQRWGAVKQGLWLPSSPLSLWLTAERLKAGKPFQTVGLNDGRYCDPSAAHYNNTMQTSHQQPCHLHLEMHFTQSPQSLLLLLPFKHFVQLSPKHNWPSYGWGKAIFSETMCGSFSLVPLFCSPRVTI